MQVEASRPYLVPDTCIPPGMPGIQDSTALIVGGERGRETEHQAISISIPEHDPRTEFLQDFQDKLNRWHEVLTIEPFSKMGRIEDTSRYVIKRSFYSVPLRLTQRGYVIEDQESVLEQSRTTLNAQDYPIPFAAWSGNKRHPGSPDRPDIWEHTSTVYSKARPGTEVERGFYLSINSEDSRTNRFSFFRDPYNNRPISFLRAGIREKPQADIPYEFFVDVIYRQAHIRDQFRDQDQYVVERAAFYEAEVPLPGTNPPAVMREIHLDKGEENNSRLVLTSEDEYLVLLSGDPDAHAKALIDFADSLIPQVNPQLPEPPAAGEQ